MIALPRRTTARVDPRAEELAAAAVHHTRAGLPWSLDEVVADLRRRAGCDDAVLLDAAQVAHEGMGHCRSVVLAVEVLRLAARPGRSSA